MTETVFTDILKDAAQKGIIPERTKTARNWFAAKAKLMRNVDLDAIEQDQSRLRGSVVPGRMYIFHYDPKLKQKLPYYDELPLVIVMDVRADHFLGLNLHYLPHQYRVKLMDALYSLLNNNLYNETTKIQLTYRILKNASRFRYFKPCIKKYLKGHVDSKFISVGANEWSIAMFLPLERFAKATTSEVWADSTKMINQNTLWGKTKKRAKRLWGKTF